MKVTVKDHMSAPWHKYGTGQAEKYSKSNMKVVFYSLHKFEIPFLEKVNAGRYEMHFLDLRLSARDRPPKRGFRGSKPFCKR